MTDDSSKPIHDAVHDIDIFFSWSQLQGRRLFTAKVWQKRGYLPIPDIAPAAVLCLSTIRVQHTEKVIPSYYMVVSRSEDTLTIVDTSCNLYSYEQVEPIYVQKRRTSVESTTSAVETSINTSIHSSPSPSPLPFVPQKVDRNDVSADVHEGFVIIKQEKDHKGKAAYVPECFTVEDEQTLGLWKEEAYCVFHMLHYLRVTQQKGKDAWIDLACNLMEDLMGWRSWQAVKALLLNSGILEQTKVEQGYYDTDRPRGIKGCRAYGYRFRNPAYRNAKFRLRLLSKKKLIDRLHGYKTVTKPVQTWLKKNLEKVEILDVADEKLREIAVAEDIGTGSIESRVDSYREQIRWIREKVWRFQVDGFSHRIHTNLTQLKTELRAYLRVDGQPLVEIDIKNSQPLFIGLAAKEKGVVDERYLELCQQDLYQYLADKGGWDRKRVKQQLTQQALFASNYHDAQRSPVKMLFDSEFPRIAEFIRRQKVGKKTDQNPKPWNKLAELAQRKEADFVISKVCDRIRQENPKCWVTTIHDSILTVPQFLDLVMAVMRDEFAKLGVEPKLKAVTV